MSKIIVVIKLVREIRVEYNIKPSQTLVVHFPDGSVCNKVLVMD